MCTEPPQGQSNGRSWFTTRKPSPRDTVTVVGCRSSVQSRFVAVERAACVNLLLPARGATESVLCTLAWPDSKPPPGTDSNASRFTELARTDPSPTGASTALARPKAARFSGVPRVPRVCSLAVSDAPEEGS